LNPTVDSPEGAAKAPVSEQKVTSTPVGGTATAIGGGVSIVTIKTVADMVSEANNQVAGKVGPGFLGQAAIMLICFMVLFGLAMIAYNVWKEKQDAAGKSQPPTLFGKIQELLLGAKHG
jgi:hypothetical protein